MPPQEPRGRLFHITAGGFGAGVSHPKKGPWPLSPTEGQAMEGIDKQVLTSLALWLLSRRADAKIPTIPTDLWQEPPNPSCHAALDGSTCFCFTS